MLDAGVAGRDKSSSSWTSQIGVEWFTRDRNPPVAFAFGFMNLQHSITFIIIICPCHSLLELVMKLERIESMPGHRAPVDVEEQNNLVIQRLCTIYLNASVPKQKANSKIVQ